MRVRNRMCSSSQQPGPFQKRTMPLTFRPSLFDTNRTPTCTERSAALGLCDLDALNVVALELSDGREADVLLFACEHGGVCQVRITTEQRERREKQHLRRRTEQHAINKYKTRRVGSCQGWLEHKSRQSTFFSENSGRKQLSSCLTTFEQETSSNKPKKKKKKTQTK